MSRQNRPGGGASARPAGTGSGPLVRRAVALPSAGDDAEQALRPAPRRSTATASAATALGGTGTAGEAGREETETTSAAPGQGATVGSRTASAPEEPEARAETTASGADRREQPETAADAAASARTMSRGGTGGALSGLAAVLGGVRRSGSAGAGSGSGDDDGDGSPGRPKAPMLAAAGIAGVILIAVPLLIMAGNERDKHSEEHTTVAADSRTLGDQQEAQQPPDVYVAESPKDDTSPAPSKDGKEGKTAEDGGKVSSDGPSSPSSVAADGASSQSALPKKESVAKEPAQLLAKKTVEKPVTIASARIVSADTGKCLTAASRGVGAELVVQPCGSSEGAQIWSFHDEDRTLRIGQSLCMGLDGGSVSNGTAIRLQQCNGSDGQKFKINATEDLVSLKAGNKCADVWWGDGADGTPIKLWPCTGTANQTWRRG